MAIGGRWWKFIPGVVQFERDLPGVYELGDKNEAVIYIGSSNSVKRRLSDHLQSADNCIRENAVLYRIEYHADYEKREQEVYRGHLAEYGKPPRCNPESTRPLERPSR